MKVERVSNSSIIVTADNGDVFDIIDNGEGVEFSSHNGKALVLEKYKDSIYEIGVLK